MPGRRREIFTTIHTEGGLLPSDFLQRVAEGQAAIPGLTPEAYHLTGGEKLNEAASRSWNRLQGTWASFRAASSGISDSEPGTSVTREKWLLPLFQELGYGRLVATKAFEIEGKSYPVSHLWHRSPIHLVGRNVDLDKRSPGVAGAARTSPHGLVQEFLNRSDDHVWGFVSNGHTLRILRDNKSLTRQAYVEFDLAGMMEGQVYSDFAVLWLLCHESRVEAEKPLECWLEKWSETAREQGTRALDDLRVGVEKAIEALGRGFLAHGANASLKENLQKGNLSKQDYYRELLRTVYRLIFLFVAEDRGLLLVSARGSTATERYTRYYSMGRLRALAEKRRGSPHADLWRALRLVFEKLGSAAGCLELGLPALGSFLWSQKASPSLDSCELTNASLLEAIRSLAFTIDRGIRRGIDYKNLGPEELGSVYESLLELHPDINADAATFALATAAGHERKTTGSYYTPTSLIECLLDSALDPVLEDAAKKPDPEKAILNLKVCDPACGSGHFLIAAAHRMARRLASVRTGDEEPSPDAVRVALRDVIGHCLYGVDVNPMAVELCKVNLWIEALVAGKPLSFLESRILCGNSLLGATPALLEGGIPDEAFNALTGDDKDLVRALRKRNRAEHEGQLKLPLLAAETPPSFDALADAFTRIAETPDDTIAHVQEKEKTWVRLLASTQYTQERLLADAWCAAFVWKKKKGAPPAITQDVFFRLRKDPEAVPGSIREEIARIADSYHFFHWHVGFPDVIPLPAGGEKPENALTGWSGGFDVILGNPPWERIKLQEKEWFAERNPEIAEAPNAAARRRLIKALATEDPPLREAFQEALRQADGESALVRSTGRFPLCGRGDINTYAVFAELNRSLIEPRGRVGCIVPSGIATDDTTKLFFQDLVRARSLVSLYSFENEEFLFPAVHHAMKFCLITVSGTQRVRGAADFLFFARQVAALKDPDRHFSLGADDIALLNPNTRTCPIFRTRRDAELTKAIYGRVPVLVNENQGEEGNPWSVKFLAMLHMANDSGIFRTASQLDTDGWVLEGNVFHRGDERYLPLYEAKMIHHFTHRYGDYRHKLADSESTALPDVPDSLLADPMYTPLPRYWVPEGAVEDRLRGRWDRGWLLGWRDITNATNERTVIASVIPRVGVGHKFPLAIVSGPPTATSALLANFDSFAFDYVARQKLGGTSLTYFVLKQLPTLLPPSHGQPAPWARDETIAKWIRPRVLELVHTAWDLEPFGKDLGWAGPPFQWDPDRRFLIRCELDAAFFHLYGIARDDVDYVLESFPIVRRHDEKKYGDYRTKLTVLDIYDRMQAAIGSGRPYETLLSPPPADPAVSHSDRPSVAQR